MAYKSKFSEASEEKKSAFLALKNSDTVEKSVPNYSLVLDAIEEIILDDADEYNEFKNPYKFRVVDSKEVADELRTKVNEFLFDNEVHIAKYFQSPSEDAEMKLINEVLRPLGELIQSILDESSWQKGDFVESYKPRFSENMEMKESAATDILGAMESAIETLSGEDNELSKKAIAHLKEKFEELRKLFKDKFSGKKEDSKEDKEPKVEKEDKEEKEESEDMKEGFLHLNDPRSTNHGGFDDEDEEEFTPDRFSDIFVFSDGSGTLVAYEGINRRKYVGSGSKDNVSYLLEQIKEFQEREGFAGNVWRVNRRGQIEDLFDPSFYESTKVSSKVKESFEKEEPEFPESEEDIEDINEEGPQEDDIAVESTGPLGSRYSVGVVNGRHIGEFSNAEEVNEAIDEYKRRHNYYPTVWYIDDHGGYNIWNE